MSLSPSDLTAAAACEFAFLRRVDFLTRPGIAPLPDDDDPMLRLASVAGNEHEARVLAEYERRGLDIATIPAVIPGLSGRAKRTEQARLTAAAFARGAEVVYQAAFITADFTGYADFIVRQGDGSYEVQDTKVARSAKVPALLQLSAYAAQMRELGIPVAPTTRLILGTGEEHVAQLAQIDPVYTVQDRRLRRLVADRMAAPEALEWGDPTVAACGRCPVCSQEVALHQDLFLVANLRASQRAKLREAGIATVSQLAESNPEDLPLPLRTARALQEQAELQLAAKPASPPPFRVRDTLPLQALPEPSPGDLFFDFEGDPMWHSEPVVSGSGGAGWGEVTWSLDYLFGLVDPQDNFTSFWAHDLAQERQALTDFMHFVAQRRRIFPDMRIFHYASYERTHLLSLAARHNLFENEVDQLLRDGVLVDLYPIVRGSLLIGAESYSLKTVELLFNSGGREEDVASAIGSVEEYRRYAEIVETDPEQAAALLQNIADYNHQDCISTRKLRDWLLELARSRGIVPGTAEFEHFTEGEERAEANELEADLFALAGDRLTAERSQAERAYGLLGAAVQFHRRERKLFWQEHYTRLTCPVDDLEETRNVFIAQSAQVLEDWEKPTPRSLERRRIRLHGAWTAGSNPSADGKMYALYEPPAPFEQLGLRPNSRGWVEVEFEDEGDSVIITERLRRDQEPRSEVPMLLVPAAPPATKSIDQAIKSVAERALGTPPSRSSGAINDLLLCREPRFKQTRNAGSVAPGETIDALVADLLNLDHSYFAVQGPPGTGKTYTSAAAIARLVLQHGWKVGVVAQSHATVENLLAKLAEFGVPSTLMGKKPKGGQEGRITPWTKLTDTKDQNLFITEPGGRVLGGTAWTFTNANVVSPGSLDLLVIDEAGQFSMANTIGVSAATKNLLLVGDPQQLPQVSQALHPEPVNEAALDLIMGGSRVLDPKFGHFLGQTWRMSAELTDRVSDLAYEGKLESHPVTSDRHLDGLTPGIHAVPLPTLGYSTENYPEAQQVVRIVQDLLGRQWTSSKKNATTTELREQDFIVITPYNAQVGVIEAALRAAGLMGVEVGTVDKFQGKEAVISITSLAASSGADAARGLKFLLMRNRINVAVSRGKWASFVVFSPHLLEDLPRTPQDLVELGDFIKLLAYHEVSN